MTLAFLRDLGTVSALLAFIAICVWAYSGKRKAEFDEAANLPFADDDAHEERKR
jgi:cytochrome c oxidase cbb3-type subunit IV